MNYNKLTKEEEKVILHKGTEMPYTGKYVNNHQPGVYTCKRCSSPLYLSENKFDSGCGWPSFDQEIETAVKETPDADQIRTEITCAKCGAHLGHVFFGEHFTSKNTRHCVNSISMNFINANIEKIALAGGCFWCIESAYSEMEGIIKAVSGYTDGKIKDPNYEQVCSGKTGHAEAVLLYFNKDKISLDKILDVFFKIHDPTQVDGQGADIGTQYRSGIYYTNDMQKAMVQKFISEKQKDFDQRIVTEVKQLKEFYPAEEYHQNYYKKNPNSGYCRAVIKPKLDKLGK